MEKLSVKNLIKHRFILFLPVSFVYTGVLLLIMSSLDLSHHSLQSIVFFPTVLIIINQGINTYDYFTKKIMDKTILILSWILAIIGIGLMVLLYFVRS